LGSARCNRITKNLAAVLMRAMRGVEGPTCFDAPEATQELGCRDGSDLPRPDPGEKIKFKPSDDLLGMVWRPHCGKFCEPLSRDSLESFRSGGVFGLSLYSRIEAIHQLTLRFIAFFSRLLERH